MELVPLQTKFQAKILNNSIIWKHQYSLTQSIILGNSSWILYNSCYYVSLGIRAHEPRRLYTYIIGVYIMEPFHDYSVKYVIDSISHVFIL